MQCPWGGVSERRAGHALSELGFTSVPHHLARSVPAPPPPPGRGGRRLEHARSNDSASAQTLTALSTALDEHKVCTAAASLHWPRLPRWRPATELIRSRMHIRLPGWVHAWGDWGVGGLEQALLREKDAELQQHVRAVANLQGVVERLQNGPLSWACI